MCQNLEATANYLQSLVANKAEVSKGVAVVGAVLEKRRSGPKARPLGDQERGALVCSCCGQAHKSRQCTAYGQRCRKCQALNHFAKVCKNFAIVAAALTWGHLLEGQPLCWCVNLANPAILLHGLQLFLHCRLHCVWNPVGLVLDRRYWVIQLNVI